MVAFLYSIELSNFKSFPGLYTIGPLDPDISFAIIGPNGAGKSNIIDAVAFCTGEKLSNLRVQKLNDLVHKSSDSGSRSTFVAITLKRRNDEEVVFKRIIIRNSSTYQLNGQNVGREEYHRKLKEMSINIAAKNFIIHQDDINSMWVMSPKERTMLFEQITQSIVFKEEYNRLKGEIRELNCTTKELQSEKKRLIAFHKMLKSARLAEHSEQQLLEDYDKTLIRSTLLDLYFIDLRCKQFKHDLVEMNARIEEFEAQIHEAQGRLDDENIQLSGLNTTVVEVEKKVDDAQKRFNQIESKLSNHQGKITICEKRATKLEKSLVVANNAKKSHENQIAELKESLKELKEAKDRYIEQCSQQFERPLEVIAEWDQKYNALEAIVIKRTIKNHNEITSLERVRQSFLDKLENVNRKRDEIQSIIARRITSRGNIVERMKTMENNIQKTKEELQDKLNLLQEMTENIESSEKLQKNLERDLLLIRDKLMNCEISEEQRNRVVEEKKMVQALSGSFDGVYDRVYNLFRPKHNRYKIACTKVFGTHFSSIIVNTSATAMKCIKYLKEYRIGIATFLPLDNLQIRRLKERLRSFEEQEGISDVKLLYDVIEFPHEMEIVALHIARNTLVCETAEIANHVANDLPSGNKYNCVALDGSYYHKSGMFSGGTVSLEKKSGMLNAAAREEIDAKKDEICQALKKIRNSKNQADKGILQVEVEQLKGKLKYFKEYFEEIKSDSVNVEAKIEESNALLQEVEGVTLRIKADINILNDEIEAVQSKIDKVKNRVFTKLCTELGITNIRKYEESLRSFKEMKTKELEYDSQCERIQSLLEYEETRNMQCNVQEINTKIEHIRQQIHKLRSEESELIKQHNEAERNLNNCRTTLEVTLAEVAKLKELTGRDKELLEKVMHSRTILDDETKMFAARIMENFRKRHNLLIEAKINDINLPLLDGGSLDTILDTFLIGEECDSSQELVEMYEQEDELKFDYTYLVTKPKSVQDEIGFVDIKTQIKEELTDLECKISKFEATTKTSQEIEKVQIDLENVTRRLAETLKIKRKIHLSFKGVKEQRLKAFMGCYKHAVANIDKIYKEMNDDESAQASLWAEDEEEPYLAGINYVCIPPRKRHSSGNLSGGESALASLSLMFSIRSQHPSPFLLLDEVDAALDMKNRKSVVSYFESIRDNQQIISISLNKQWFCNADAFIGVYKDRCDTPQAPSNIIILDLSEYQ